MESSHEIGPTQMLAFQATYQRKWADDAVSYAVKPPEGKYSDGEATAVIKGWQPN